MIVILCEKVKSAPIEIGRARRPARLALFSSFCSMNRLEVFLLPLHRILVHCSLSPNNLLVLIYTPGCREAL